MQPLQIFHGLLAMAVDVGNFRLLAYPQAAVDAASQMLGEVPVEFGPHHARLLGEIDTDPLIGGRREKPFRVVRMAAVAAPAPRTNPRREIGWLIIENTLHLGTVGMQALSIAIFFYLSAGLATAQSVYLTVNTDTVLHSIDPKIYAQSIDGGIWGEAVWNRSFEEALTQGVWKVKDGVLEAAGADGDSQFRFGTETWRDYDLTADALRPAGNGVLVVAVRSDRNANYALSLGGPGGFELTRTTDTGAATVLQSAAEKLENGRWYKVRVKIEGTRLQVWIDGRMLFDVSAPDGPSNGQAFFAVRSGAPVSPISA